MKMRKYLKIFTCGVQDATAYRGNLIVGVLSNFIITAVMFYIWQVIYAANVTIGSYNWEDMKTYLFISFICNSTLSWAAETKISKKIITGEITSDLIKPMGFMRMTFFETAGAGVPVSVISISIMTVVAVFMKIQMPASPIVYFVFIISHILSFVINFLVSFICALFCFWTENYFGIVKSKQVVVNFFSGALIPLNMMPEMLQKIAFALPFQGIVFIPSSIFMETVAGMDAIYLMLSQVVWCIILYIVQIILWHCAIKKVVINGG